jgi:formylmethanofuran dehydrogenase subunit C
MAIEIELSQTPSVPLEVEKIRPDLMLGQTPTQIMKEKIFHGKEEIEFGEFFSVKGDSQDQTHCWNGDMSGVHWIGKCLSSGKITVNGNCGRHLGSEMSGGEISVSDDASDWVGAEMSGGLIRVDGNAGHLIGAAYRGSARGMRGGTILVKGKTGNEVGHTMRRGMIAVGAVGDLTGFNMLAGSILVFGECGIRHGAGMHRGNIAFLGSHRPEALPTFRFSCRQDLTILCLAKKYLLRNGFDFPFPDYVDLYHGDFLEGGRGEILLAA